MIKKPFWGIIEDNSRKPKYIDVNNILNKEGKIPKSWKGKPVLVPIRNKLTECHVISIVPNKLRPKSGNLTPKGRQPRKERKPREERQPRKKKNK